MAGNTLKCGLCGAVVEWVRYEPVSIKEVAGVRSRVTERELKKAGADAERVEKALGRAAQDVLLQMLFDLEGQVDHADRLNMPPGKAPGGHFHPSAMIQALRKEIWRRRHLKRRVVVYSEDSVVKVAHVDCLVFPAP